MNRLEKIFCLMVLTTSFYNMGCQSKAKTPSTPSESPKTETAAVETPASWPDQMQRLTVNLSELLPIITDSKSYSDPEKRKLLESRMTELQSLAHAINESTPTPDQDPSLKLIGRRFEDNLKLAVESFKSGHMEFSRSVFKNALAQCVQCHTRLATGPTLAQPQFLGSLKNIAIVERVQLLIASRYFDEAMSEITQALEKSDNLSIVAWQKLVQMGLVINVRFRGDVKKTQDFVQLIRKNQDLPYFIKRQLPFWEQSVKDWSRNPKPSINLKTALQIFNRAEAAQKISRSEGGTIDYLRAGSVLHKFLAHSQAPSEKSEALYQLGMIYENLGEIGAWSMNEDYYELCIKTQPHSEIAKKCFARLQESTISGFSGTGGIYIPDDIQKKMNELRAIAL